MRLTTLRKDEDLKTLVRRVYKEASAKVLDQAEKAVLKANPGLAEGRLREGTVVVVPDVKGTATVGEQESGAQVVGSILRAAVNQFPSVQKAVTPMAGQQEDAAKLTISRANTPDLVKLASRNPDLRKSLDSVLAAANADLKQASALRATQEKGFAETEKDLQNLLSLFGEKLTR